jgi:hypothetical protein
VAGRSTSGCKILNLFRSRQMTPSFPRSPSLSRAAPRQVGETHPFIVGADSVQRYFTVMSECATASKLRAGAK